MTTGITTESDADFKVRENRVRRMAARQGLILRRSRRRDPRAYDYGLYWLIEKDTNGLMSEERGEALDSIEAWLTR